MTSRSAALLAAFVLGCSGEPASQPEAPDAAGPDDWAALFDEPLSPAPPGDQADGVFDPRHGCPRGQPPPCGPRRGSGRSPPARPTMDAPSGEAYARNFFIKSMVLAQAQGYLGLDWFALSDAADDASPFGKMGLYNDVKDLAQEQDAVRTPTGVAARTLGTLLRDAVADHAATDELLLPPEARGAAFRLPDDRRALVLWARAAGSDETGAAMIDLATDAGFSAHAWDYSATNTATPLAPVDGKIALALTADPVILIAD